MFCKKCSLIVSGVFLLFIDSVSSACCVAVAWLLLCCYREDTATQDEMCYLPGHAGARRMNADVSVVGLFTVAEICWH